MYTNLCLEFKRLHPECTDYKTLNDSRRSLHHGNGTREGAEPEKCDNNESKWSKYTSPDWVGAGWYRMMVGDGGTRIPESPPGVHQCGAHVTGWLKGSHPAVAGQSTKVTFCFDPKG